MRKCTGNIVQNMLILSGISLYSTSAMAGVYTTIDVTGPASQFDSIPTAASVPVNPAATQIDPLQLKIANDSQYLYLYVGYSSAFINPNASGLFLAIDSDNNPATGDAIYGSSLIGSNL